MTIRNAVLLDRVTCCNIGSQEHSVLLHEDLLDPWSFWLQHIIRKERAVGLIPGAPTIYEVLEELAITVQQQLVDAPLPFCAFNGGGDVFVDVGNKSLGLEALMQYLKFNPSQVPMLMLYMSCMSHHACASVRAIVVSYCKWQDMDVCDDV